MNIKRRETDQEYENEINRTEGYIEALEFAYEATEVRSVKIEILEQIKTKVKYLEGLNIKLRMKKEAS